MAKARFYLRIFCFLGVKRLSTPEIFLDALKMTLPYQNASFLLALAQSYSAHHGYTQPGVTVTVGLFLTCQE